MDETEILKQEIVYQGRIVDLEVDQVRVRGIDTVREVVRHPGGVVVLAEVKPDRIPFVRQYRYPIGKPLLELPAGKLDGGEDPQVAAERELEEETGFKATAIQRVCGFYSSPGFCDELLHFFYTDQVVETSVNHEHDEQIEIEFHRLGEALEMIQKGEILDGKTITALYWLACRRQGAVST